MVTAVEDRDHNVLESFGTPRRPSPAMSNQAAQTLLDVMRGVIDSGTAVGLRPRFGLTGDLAGKTGTTQDNTDGWFILMHPQLVAGAWTGFNDNRVAMRSSYWGQGAHNALLVVGDFMQQAQKAGLVDTKAAFAAPRMQDQEQPLLQGVKDWWNSVFNTPPTGERSGSGRDAAGEPGPAGAGAAAAWADSGSAGEHPAGPAVIADAPVLVGSAARARLPAAAGNARPDGSRPCRARRCTWSLFMVNSFRLR
jgi:penicillin-binding protein 1A